MAAQSSNTIPLRSSLRKRSTSRAVRPRHELELELALLSGCHEKTAKKALAEGVEKIRGKRLRERLRAGAATLGVPLPLPSTDRESAA